MFQDAQDYIRSKIKSISYRYYYNLKPCITELHRKVIKATKSLSSDKTIIITRSDKVNSI